MKIIGSGNSVKNRIDQKLLSLVDDDISIIETPDSEMTDSQKRCCIVLPESPIVAKELVENLKKHGIHQVIQNTDSKFLREISIASLLIQNPMECLNDPISVITGKDTLLKSLTISANRSDERASTIEKVVRFLESMPSGEILKDSVRLITDELFTNAIYNAPTDSTGKRIYSDFTRKESVTLADKQKATFYLSYDKNRFFIGCVDPFGSLTIEKFLNGLQSCYAYEDLAQVNRGPGGAGIGTRMLLDRSSELFIVCRKGVQTFFGCCLPLGRSARAAGAIPKNIHFIFTK